MEVLKALMGFVELLNSPGLELPLLGRLDRGIMPLLRKMCQLDFFLLVSESVPIGGFPPFYKIEVQSQLLLKIT